MTRLTNSNNQNYQHKHENPTSAERLNEANPIVLQNIRGSNDESKGMFDALSSVKDTSPLFRRNQEFDMLGNMNRNLDVR